MQEIAIAFFAIFPFERIRWKVENIAGCPVQSAAVDGKVAACGIIGNQVIGRGRGRFGLGAADVSACQSTRQFGAAGTQYPQPAVINQDAAGFINDRAHK